MKEGWTYKKLGEVARVQNGYAFDSKLFNENGNGTPLIRIRDIKRNHTYTYTTEDCSKEFFIENGDLLIGMDGDFNVCTWEGGHAYLNQRVCHVIPSNQVIAKFLYYLLPFPLKRINDKTTFATVKHLSSKQVGNIMMPVPSLDEQQRIVERLDSAFENIDKLKANAEKQLAEARILFQKSLAKAMEPKEGWEERNLKEITTKIGSGATPLGGRKVYINEGVSLVRSMNVHYNEFKYDDLAHINDDAANQLSGVELKQNDVLFNITGASIARCCVLPDDVIPARVNQHVAILRPVTEIITPQYLCLCLISSKHQTKLLKKGEAGSTRQALTKADLENYTISLPPLSVQQRIVERLDSLSENVRKYEEIQRQIISECDALKQALLRKVFE